MSQRPETVERFDGDVAEVGEIAFVGSGAQASSSSPFPLLEGLAASWIIPRCWG